VPAEQTLRTNGDGKFSLDLRATAGDMTMASTVIRVTISSGAQYLDHLALLSAETKVSGSATSYEFKIEGPGPGTALDFEFGITWGNTALTTNAAKPDSAVGVDARLVDLRVELTSPACPQITAATRPSARVVIQPSAPRLDTPKPGPVVHATDATELSLP
jgi:hypothetical protein